MKANLCCNFMKIYQPYQTTLRKAISCEGIGVHSGERVLLEVLPAPENTGIIFERTDLEGENRFVQAQWDKVVDTMMCTRIANEHGVTVATIEHFMAALFACGVHNAHVKVNNTELPIMDGSSAPFISFINKAGIKQQQAPKRFLKVLKTVTYEKNGAYAHIEPCDTLVVDFEFDFRGRAGFPPQTQSYAVDHDHFDTFFGSARTFGILEEVNKLWEAGLAKGGSLENAVVVSGNSVLNEGGLRFEDEFVRHKILDAVGDLYLAGPILGRFVGKNAGHGINNMLLRTLFADTSAWEWTTQVSAAKSIHKRVPTPVQTALAQA